MKVKFIASTIFTKPPDIYTKIVSPWFCGNKDEKIAHFVKVSELIGSIFLASPQCTMEPAEICRPTLGKALHSSTVKTSPAMSVPQPKWVTLSTRHCSLQGA